MVQLALTFGAVVGVVLSAGYVWWEVGRYAAPQVPESRFDERKEMFAYTAGLFAGIPLAAVLLLLLSAFPAGFIVLVAIYLAILVGGAELGQWLMLRSIYFGSDGSGPFYAVGFRAGVAGILILALVAQALSSPNLTLTTLGVALVQSAALLALGVTGAIFSLRTKVESGPSRGGPTAGAMVTGFGLFLLTLGPAFGASGAAVAAAIVAVVAVLMYRRIARATLDRVRPIGQVRRTEDDDEGTDRSPFGRTDR
ncbi:MAG: hypothetical protein L3K00_08530 [Thermoplasmata archaeon]|nr:hypothetical protein [Thermoplasmata archaeon]